MTKLTIIRQSKLLDTRIYINIQLIIYLPIYYTHVVKVIAEYSLEISHINLKNSVILRLTKSKYAFNNRKTKDCQTKDES